MVLEKRSAVMTGASGGLGEQIALRLASEGWDIFLLGRDKGRLREVFLKIQTKYPSIQAKQCVVDFSKESDIDSFLSEDMAVDILINCAGVFPVKSLCDSTPHDYKTCFDINVKAPFLLSQKFSKGMANRKWGRIVNICSSSSYQGSPENGLYCASKHALLGLSRSQYLELKPHNVRVFSVSPGSIQTEMGETVPHQDFSTFMRAEEVADYIIYIIKFDSEMISEEVRLNRITIR